MMKRNNLQFGAVILSLALILTGCQSSPPPAPVSMIGERGKTHMVRRGETLYAIAWRYGLDYKALAKRNGISPPYTIYAGQKLKLSAAAKSKPSSRQTASAKTEPNAVYKQKPVAKPTPKLSTSRINWQWPVEGEVKTKFSLSGSVNKGIDIQSAGQANVKAAAPGTVVYAGGNLRGYGKLVIIKHDATFLSAYGNNEALAVKEGDAVSAGQNIATLGSDQVLHFEIRRDGRPEDPEGHLP